MANLFDMKGGKMLAVLSKIAEKMPPDIGEEIGRDPELVDIMLWAVQRHLGRMPYEITVEDTLAALRRANDEESVTNPNWVRIPEEDIARLATTAPPWPKGGRHLYRSLRIRFGEGDEGVARTFEAHVTRIKTVFGEKGFRRCEHLHSGSVLFKGESVEQLRLLAGNHTHKPVIEWVIADLDANRMRDSWWAVRGPQSLADELLVIVWLFPDIIDYDKYPGWFAAGYEATVPEYGDGAWQYVVFVNFDRNDRQIRVENCGRGVDFCAYPVPVLRK